MPSDIFLFFSCQKYSNLVLFAGNQKELSQVKRPGGMTTHQCRHIPGLIAARAAADNDLASVQ